MVNVVKLQKIIERLSSPDLKWQRTSKGICSFIEGRGCSTIMLGFEYIIGRNIGIDEYTQDWHSLDVYRSNTDIKVADYSEDLTNPLGPLGNLYGRVRGNIIINEEFKRGEIMRRGRKEFDCVLTEFCAQY